MEYPFVNDEALEPEIPVICVPILRQNELWAFFEVPAHTFDRYADRGLGRSIMFVVPKPTSTIPTGVTPHEASPVKARRRRVKEKPSGQQETAGSAGADPELPEVPPRGRKKKGGAGRG